MISDDALRQLRDLISDLPTEDGRHHVNDMVIWAAEHGDELLRELDAGRASPAWSGEDPRLSIDHGKMVIVVLIPVGNSFWKSYVAEVRTDHNYSVTFEDSGFRPTYENDAWESDWIWFRAPSRSGGG